MPFTLKSSYRLLFISISIQILAATLFHLSQAHAHAVGQSYIFLRVYDNELSGTFEITMRDLNKGLEHSRDEDQITEGNLSEKIDEVHAYFNNKVGFFNGNDRLTIQWSDWNTRKLKIGQYILLNFTIIKDASIPEKIGIDYNIMFDQAADHQGLLVIEHFWNANLFNNEAHVSLIFSPSKRRQDLSLAGHTRLQGFLGIVQLGMKHIWIGIDHILFLLALILPASMHRKNRKWEPVADFRPAIISTVKIVTLFTISHSITLSMAALGIVSLPAHLVEPVIAISIAVVALDIIFPIFRKKIMWIVFIFGLFHGFGFASVLAELGVLGEHMLLSLFGFNLGVEIGQVVVICLIFPLIYFFRRYDFYPKIVMRYSAAAMILMATFWFLDRTFLDIDLTGILRKSLASIIH